MAENLFIEMIGVISTTSILAGLAGGFVRGLVGISKTILKQKKKLDPARLVFFIIVSGITGGVAGSLFEGSWMVSLLIGYAGADILESMYKIAITNNIPIFLKTPKK